MSRTWETRSPRCAPGRGPATDPGADSRGRFQPTLRNRSTRMRRLIVPILAVIATPVLAQQPPSPQPYVVGNPLGLPVAPTADRSFEPISSNVKVYGAIYSAESCSYDPERGVIVVPNRGVPQTVQTNNAWVSFIKDRKSTRLNSSHVEISYAVFCLKKKKKKKQ